MNQMLKDIDNRIALYGLTSRLMMMETDEVFLDQLEEDEDFLSLLPNYRDWDKRTKLSKKDLVNQYYNVDFANLFIMHLVPYESFYVRDDQMIESGGDNPVLSLYNALDFRVELEKARVVSPDHIGVELEFMYMLCNAQKKALKENDTEAVYELLSVQRGFLKDHLLEWAPMFLINAKRESRTPLYHDGTELTLEFLLSDYEYVVSQWKEQYLQEKEWV
ncbi:MAG: molecular chaperone TorD family protein [Sulfurovum sp.]|nr:molecular chaperone TorD family protein [Sulfurovum sp.]MCB4750260.1 molecular chaperone TorD family protein [Sulfurovum sp.]MCB4751587.1 molecular chaperone TorD family protein [Sulfurovum sp.]MCB4754198.1 molecular chaperone TorD family protein [Sulfurovum sp.]MCB4758346.1 molecular chaperone TorD family protein [Sulfurovum sp.]